VSSGIGPCLKPGGPILMLKVVNSVGVHLHSADVHPGPRPKDLLYWLRCSVALLSCVLLLMLIGAGTVIVTIGYDIYKRSPDIVRSARLFKHSLTVNAERVGNSSKAASDKAVAVMDQLNHEWEDTVETIQKAAAKAVQVVQKTDRALFGQDADADSPRLSGHYGPHGIIGQLSGILGATQSGVETLTKDVDALIGNPTTEGSIRSTLVQLKVDLQSIDQLTQAVAVAVDSNSTHTETLLQELETTVKHFTVLLDDKNLKGTIANVEGVTGTVNIALEPLRHRAKLLARIVNTFIGMLRINLL
jgi:hypothetical protein